MGGCLSPDRFLVKCVLFSKMADTCLERGFIYFDTAHGYVDGKSEAALKVCLTDRDTLIFEQHGRDEIERDALVFLNCLTWRSIL